MIKEGNRIIDTQTRRRRIKRMWQKRWKETTVMNLHEFWSNEKPVSLPKKLFAAIWQCISWVSIWIKLQWGLQNQCLGVGTVCNAECRHWLSRISGQTSCWSGRGMEQQQLCSAGFWHCLPTTKHNLPPWGSASCRCVNQPVHSCLGHTIQTLYKVY